MQHVCLEMVGIPVTLDIEAGGFQFHLKTKLNLFPGLPEHKEGKEASRGSEVPELIAVGLMMLSVS